MQNDGSVSAVKQFFRNRWVRAILILDVIAIIAVVGVIIWNATRTATINFSVAPLDAQIQIDGHGDYHNGSYQVHPGTHEITISHDGLETKFFTLDLKSGYNTTLTAFLKAASSDATSDINDPNAMSGANDSAATSSVNDPAFAFYTLKDNYASFQQLAAIASEDNNLTTDQDPSAYAFIEDFQDAAYIYDSILPLNQKEYTIEDNKDALVYDVTLRRGNSCQKYLCIEAIMISTSDQEIANSMLRRQGFNLEDYEINYKVY